MSDNRELTVPRFRGIKFPHNLRITNGMMLPAAQFFDIFSFFYFSDNTQKSHTNMKFEIIRNWLLTCLPPSQVVDARVWLSVVDISPLTYACTSCSASFSEN